MYDGSIFEKIAKENELKKHKWFNANSAHQTKQYSQYYCTIYLCR
jgi:hypothetical protein